MSIGSPRNNILVSCAGRRAELVRILQDAADTHGEGGRVYTADRSPLSAAGWVSESLDLVPAVTDPGFIDSLLEVCARRDIGHVVPTIDTELPILASNRHRFTAIGTNVWISSEETIAIAHDKRATHRWLTENGFPVVGQWDLEQVDRRGGGQETALPLIAKPAGGSSSVGLQVVRSHEELTALDRRLDYVLEEIAPGVEFTVDALVDSEGACRCAVPRLRIETRGGEVSKAKTVRDQGLIDLASSIAEALPGAYGILNIQIMKEPKTGATHVIEINARVGGGFPLTRAAGCQMPLWLVQQSSGVATTASLDWLDQQVMLRYDAAVHLDCRGSL